MADLAAIAEIRARLTTDEFKQGSEEVRRYSDQLKTMLAEVEKGFENAGRSANTSERALESFWGSVNRDVSRANQFARTMERFKEFSAANPNDVRLPLILSDINAKFADLGTVAQKAAGGIDLSDAALRKWQVAAVRVGQVTGALGPEFSAVTSAASAFATAAGGPIALGVTAFAGTLALLVSKMREVPQYTDEARASLEKLSAQIGASAVGRELGIGKTPQDPIKSAISLGGAIRASEPSARQQYIDQQATAEQVALLLATSKQRELDAAQAEQEARQRAIAGFSRISSPELDARVRGQLDAGYAAANPFPQETAKRREYVEQLRRSERERRDFEAQVTGEIEQQISALEEANKYIGLSVAQREAGLRIMELERRTGTQLTEMEKERVRAAVEYRRIREYTGQFERAATQDFAQWMNSIVDTGQLNFRKLFSSVLMDWTRLLNQMAAEAAAKKLFGSKESGGGGLGDLISSGLSALFGGGGSSVPSSVPITSQIFGSNPGGYLGARAGGGAMLPGQEYLVGENGPEIVSLGSYGMTTPAGRMGGNTTVFNIDARGAQRGVGEEIQQAVARALEMARGPLVAEAAGVAYGAVAQRFRNTGRAF